MKLTRNDLAVLLNYYTGLEFDLEDRMETFKKDCIGLLDSDLFDQQMNRYKAKLKEYESRIDKLQVELDELF